MKKFKKPLIIGSVFMALGISLFISNVLRADEVPIGDLGKLRMWKAKETVLGLHCDSGGNMQCLDTLPLEQKPIN